MKSGLGPSATLSQTRRPLGRGQSSFVVYAAIALFLIASEALAPSIPERARAIATDVIEPLLSLADRPIRAIQGGLERIAGVSDIYVENEALREEVRALRQFKSATIELNRENERLRAMLRAPSREVPTAATGRVIGIGGGTFERTIVIDVGAAHGVRRDAPVLDESGVLGRVIAVGRSSARVLLLSDLNSHIPVRNERSGIVGILRGQNGPELVLDFVENLDQVAVGDILVTSGHNTVFPPDLAIARITKIEDEVITAVALAGDSQLSDVRVLNYQPLSPDDKVILGVED